MSITNSKNITRLIDILITFRERWLVSITEVNQNLPFGKGGRVSFYISCLNFIQIVDLKHLSIESLRLEIFIDK